jgi:hypothetical protein
MEKKSGSGITPEGGKNLEHATVKASFNVLPA